MSEVRLPKAHELRAAERDIEAHFEPKARDNALFRKLFSYENSLVCRVYPKYARTGKQRGFPNGRIARDADGNPIVIGERRLPLRRRQWIETYVRIRDEHEQIVPLTLNASQRRLECAILRQERQGRPVRQIILKARKLGFSTYVQAIAFERAMRTEHVQVGVCAHTESAARYVLGIAITMLEKLPRGRGSWNFSMKARRKDRLEWAAPISSELIVASAQEPDPLRGCTPTLLHLSEYAYYPDPEKVGKALFNALPKTPRSMCFIESTANGDTGDFRNRFWAAWDERETPASARESIYEALFFAWFEREDRRYSKTIGSGKPPPDELAEHIRKTLTDEEEWLLEQTYYQRWTKDSEWGYRRVKCVRKDGVVTERTIPSRIGVGPRKVDYDQLAWRRAQIREECGGDPLRPETWDSFLENYPARPEQAFLASGNVIFDTARIHELLKKVETPIFTGELSDHDLRPDDFGDAEKEPEEKKMALDSYDRAEQILGR